MQPETRYAKSGDVHVACQAFGEGPINLGYGSVFRIVRHGVGDQSGEEGLIVRARMPARSIAGRQDREHRRRREHIDGYTARSWVAHIVAFWRPVQQGIAAHREGFILQRDECAIGELIELAPVQALSTAAEAFGV